MSTHIKATAVGGNIMIVPRHAVALTEESNGWYVTEPLEYFEKELL